MYFLILTVVSSINLHSCYKVLEKDPFISYAVFLKGSFQDSFNNILYILSCFRHMRFILKRFLNHPSIFLRRYEGNNVSGYVSIICNCGW
jgi:hypothetical protein